MSVSHSVLSSRPRIRGPERHQHGPPLWRRRTDAAVTADRLSAGTPKGTLTPRTHLPAGDRRPHSPGGRGSWRGGAGRGPSGLSVDEMERGSPGCLSEMSLSLPGPGANLSLRGPRLFPQRLKSEMNLSEQFTYDRPRQCMKTQRHYFTNKGPSSQSYGFSSSHVWM